jgi:hypothetical protein
MAMAMSMRADVVSQRLPTPNRDKLTGERKAFH